MTNKAVNLSATTRTVLGKKVKRNRLKGLMPAVLYGQGVESTPLFVDLKDYRKVFAEAGTSALVDLTIDDNKPIKVLFTSHSITTLWVSRFMPISWPLR